MITQEYLKSIIHYDPDTGVFTWLVDRGSNKTKGERAGWIFRTRNRNTDYRQISVLGKKYYEHVLAWLYMTGEMPTNQIDHRDHEGTNNIWLNLRLSTPSQNQSNRRGASKHSESGVKGVRWHKPTKKWQARITHQKQEIHLGMFDTPEEAAVAYAAKARELYGEFASLG